MKIQQSVYSKDFTTEDLTQITINDLLVVENEITEFNKIHGTYRKGSAKIMLKLFFKELKGKMQYTITKRTAILNIKLRKGHITQKYTLNESELTHTVTLTFTGRLYPTLLNLFKPLLTRHVHSETTALATMIQYKAKKRTRKHP